ncbi:hypothetical protein [Pseudomonas sp. ICMP 561]|uniref:hypothetical protein n=1 Tax=Pseudomonas sp. ICMP 561 TaxID=1718918 RepID=UPI000C06DD81|nr:hypothetical protein [Pseudomonas sp. ICMP 561]PHN30858.1 hypothetical protein AO242_01130 [Pseudomonas sp. ICMP 561]
MSQCFAFRFEHRESRPALLISCTTTVVPDQIIKTIKADVENNLLPSAVYVLSTDSQRNTLLNLLNDTSLMSEFDSFVGDPAQKFIPIFFNPSGEFFFCRDESPVSLTLKNNILQAGMLRIFKTRQGLISSSPNFHFLKPSNDHCNAFIRASNLLVAGEEVAFLAISLLPLLEPQPNRIYVDTSSISYLVCKAVLMSGRYGGRVPLIESYESYTAVNQSFDFVEAPESLVLISATTSGGLASKILNGTTFPNSQVVTLFYSKLIGDQIGIYDVKDAIPAEVSSAKPEDCADCARGSRLIKIVGDQFLPETPTNAQLIIKKTDFTGKRAKFFEDFAAKGLLQWRKASDIRADSKEHFYVDVGLYLQAPTEEFSGEFEKAIKKYFSRDVGKVIALDDPGSTALMESLKSIVSNNENITWSRMADLVGDSLNDAASVVVVAGAITSGRKLLDASRRLRCIAKSSSILYLVGFSKVPSMDILDQLRKDLQLGGHTLIILRECPLPRIVAQIKTAWDAEEFHLSKFAGDQLSGETVELPAALTERVVALTGEAEGSNDLFLKTTSGDTLKLRNTFAFWSGLNIDNQQATQADVYWTIQSILHDLRAKPDENGLASIYHSTVISPACFDRYNDGVIQACLLRAATPTELNYSIDNDFSQKMTDVLISVIENHENDQGEAALEFLMALWIDRLQITKDHLRNVTCKFKSSQMPEDIRFLLDQIELKLQ